MCSLMMMRLSRRNLLAGAASIAAFSRSIHAKAAESVEILRAQKVSAKLMGSDGPATGLWTFGDAWPAPVLRARQGEELKTRFINELDREITLHWYGVRGPSDLMSLKIAPGEDNALDCNFTPPDAGTFWFSPVHEVSRLREMGLYGMLVIAEKDPLPAFADLPAILDHRFRTFGTGDTEASGKRLAIRENVIAHPSHWQVGN